MKPYKEFSPTKFDVSGLGCEDQQDWLVCPVSITRDTDDALTKSNWAVMGEALAGVDPDGNDHEVHRFGHWGPGWFEIVLVRPDSRAAEIASEIETKLEDYPILDEERYSLTEMDDQMEYLRQWSQQQSVIPDAAVYDTWRALWDNSKWDSWAEGSAPRDDDILAAIPVEYVYTYGGGTVGCLYDYGPERTLDRKAAIDDLVEAYDLSPEARQVLDSAGIYYFPGTVQYCEIVPGDYVGAYS